MKGVQFFVEEIQSTLWQAVCFDKFSRFVKSMNHTLIQYVWECQITAFLVESEMECDSFPMIETIIFI